MAKTTTSADPAVAQAQKSGDGRSPKIKADIAAVVSGMTPSTTAPWIAGTVTMASPVNPGNPITSMTAARAYRMNSVRGGSLGRTMAMTAAAIRPATAARPKVTNQGSSSATASRVKGRVPPNMTTPRKPSSSPSRSRPRGSVSSVGSLPPASIGFGSFGIGFESGWNPGSARG